MPYYLHRHYLQLVCKILNTTDIFTALHTQQLKYIITDKHTADIYMYFTVAGALHNVLMVYTSVPHTLDIRQIRSAYDNAHYPR